MRQQIIANDTSPRWYEAARASATVPAAVAPLVERRTGSIEVPVKEGRRIYAWAERLPGYMDSTPPPLLFNDVPEPDEHGLEAGTPPWALYRLAKADPVLAPYFEVGVTASALRYRQWFRQPWGPTLIPPGPPQWQPVGPLDERYVLFDVQQRRDELHGSLNTFKRRLDMAAYVERLMPPGAVVALKRLAAVKHGVSTKEAVAETIAAHAEADTVLLGSNRLIWPMDLEGPDGGRVLQWGWRVVLE